jgi:hypothetical protein
MDAEHQTGSNIVIAVADWFFTDAALDERGNAETVVLVPDPSKRLFAVPITA